MREALGHLDEANFPDAEAALADVAEARPGPDVVDRHQEDDVIGDAHGVLEEAADLAPGRVW